MALPSLHPTDGCKMGQQSRLWDLGWWILPARMVAGLLVMLVISPAPQLPNFLPFQPLRQHWGSSGPFVRLFLAVGCEVVI